MPNESVAVIFLILIWWNIINGNYCVFDSESKHIYGWSIWISNKCSFVKVILYMVGSR